MSSATLTVESPDLARFQEEVATQFGPVGLQRFEAKKSKWLTIPAIAQADTYVQSPTTWNFYP